MTMRKLSKLRQWLTIEEAARHLTLVLDEEVTSADVLRLGREKHLTVSVDFVNGAYAHLGRVCSFPELVALRGAEDTSVTSLISLLGKTPSQEDRFLSFEGEAVRVSGVWDLSMQGDEAYMVDGMFHELTGGPRVNGSMGGGIVRRSGGEYAQILDRHGGEEVETRSGKTQSPYFYSPARGLGADVALVVRTEALTEFQQRLLEPTVTDKPDRLAPRERTTLLTLVVGMAIDAYAYDPTATRSPTSREISDCLQVHGLSVDDDTIRKYLKEGASTILDNRKQV